MDLTFWVVIFVKYGDKLLTKPSKQNVKSIMRKIRGTIKKFRTGKQSDLIKCLNPIIRGWVNFQKYNVSSVAFRYVDWQTFKALWRWCRRRHKNKPAAWIRDKYFHRIGNRSWTFSEKLTEDNYLALVYATDTNITRFTRIKAEANPYDEIWMEYFALNAKINPTAISNLYTNDIQPAYCGSNRLYKA